MLASELIRLTRQRKIKTIKKLIMKSSMNPLLIVLIVIILSNFLNAQSMDFEAGNSYYAKLESTSDTYRWSGLKIVNDAQTLSESNSPFMSLTINSPVMAEVSFPGANLKDGNHYYAAMLPNTFDANNIGIITSSDLDENGLFNSTLYPIFHPNYDDLNDNPKKTFCCNLTNISIGGINYTALSITLPTNIHYYLLKYEHNGKNYPLFITEFDDLICYNSTSCVGQFLLPINNNEYNFYVLNKYPTYDYTIYIDGSQTNTFPQTALPYNLTVYVTNTYTSQPAINESIVVAENNGQNIFIPYELEGYVSTAYSIGRTDDNGKETFMVAPTEYPTNDDYELFIAVKEGDSLLSQEELYITSKDTLVRQSKTLSPAALYDDTKASVNAMNQVVNYLFKWSSQMLQAKKFRLTYETTTGTFTTYDYQTSGSTMTLKTGAPNVITVYVTTGGVEQLGYKVKVKENNGYLIMNPRVSPITGCTNKDRNDEQTINTSTEFIITPTSLGVVNSNITFEILDSGNNLLNTYVADINSNLNIQTGGVYYNNDLLKTIANAMNQVINSLYYSLNN